MTIKTQWNCLANNEEPDWRQFDYLDCTKILTGNLNDNRYLLFGKLKVAFGGSLKKLHEFDTIKDCNYRADKLIKKYPHLSYKITN